MVQYRTTCLRIVFFLIDAGVLPRVGWQIFFPYVEVK